MNIDKNVINKRKIALEQASIQLKTEFFGLDLIIDKVISSVYAWYVFPELLQRPVIVNLWGMTGVGKTQLVRRLSTLLEFSKKFVEIQMDGTSGGSMYRQDSICAILSNCIDEGEPGILLLDEIQRFRTIDDDGKDLKVDRFQDIWMLLSDGKFAANSTMFQDLEMMIAQALYQDDYQTTNAANTEKPTEDKPTVIKAERMFKLYPYEAKNLKKMLRLAEPIREIMTWKPEKIQSLLQQIQNSNDGFQIDYSKLLIFISGNLDSAFPGSGNAQDSDTDADFYHQLTLQLSSAEMKKSLAKRFKPEQIARLGSNHIVYPSMSKNSYQQLIKATCNLYINEMHNATDINFSIEPTTYDTIYNNAVYPTQGTRPVFSAVHVIFGTGLVNVACWCIEHNVHHISLNIDAVAQEMVATDAFSQKIFRTHIDLEISQKKAKTSSKMNSLVAVHESGHALIYALLTKSAPLETKINAISFADGYMLPNESLSNNSITTKSTLRNKIASLLGGMIAEDIIFGADNRSIGCANDVSAATVFASSYVRQWGYTERLSVTVPTVFASSVNYNTDIDPTNNQIELILQEEYQRVTLLIKENTKFFFTIVDTILKVKTIDQNAFIDLAKPYIKLSTTAEVAEFDTMYQDFKKINT